MCSTSDIIPLLNFCLWKPVFDKVDEYNFSSNRKEKSGHWVGISEQVRHAMSFKVFNYDNHKVLFYGETSVFSV